MSLIRNNGQQVFPSSIYMQLGKTTSKATIGESIILTSELYQQLNIERRLSVTNLSSENNFADVSTDCSSRHQGESERSAKQRFYL